MKRLFLVAALVLGWSQSASAQIITPQYQAVDALNECVTWNLPGGAYSVTAQLTGTFSGTVTFRGSSDGQTYFDIAATNLSTLAMATTTTTTGQYAMANAGLVKIRACMTSYVSGGANISLTRGYGMARGTGFPSVTLNPGPLTVTSNSLGTTSFRAILAENNTAAAAGAQQYSPMVCQEGQGWKTTATAGSQSVEFCWEVQPVQGTSAPSGNYLLKASINGGAFSTVGTFTSAGRFTAAESIISGDDLTMPNSSGAFLQWTSRMRINTPTATSLRLWNDALDNTYDITLADWGTTLSAEGVSLADAATLSIGTTALGYLMVTAAEDNIVCLYALRGGGNATVEVNDATGSGCTNASGSANSINIYSSAGTIFIQNLRGGTRTIRASLTGS